MFLDSPFENLLGLQRQMNELFENYASGGESFPALNVYGNEEKLIVSAEVAGLNKEDIDITVKEDIVTLKISRKGKEEETLNYHRKERFTGEAERSFRLPYLVDAGGVNASYVDGILKIVLPRKEETKPKKIEVSVN